METEREADVSRLKAVIGWEGLWDEFGPHQSYYVSTAEAASPELGRVQSRVESFVLSSVSVHALSPLQEGEGGGTLPPRGVHCPAVLGSSGQATCSHAASHGR